MGIRETLNEKPAIAYGAVGGLLVVALFLLYLFNRGGGSASTQVTKPIGDQGYYSDDDGKTWFTDTMLKATPFKHNGKDAVRAMVYRCSDGKMFVGYLERHTEAGRKLKGLMLEIGPRPQYADPAVNEVKRPGSATWIPCDQKNMKKAGDEMTVKCPGNPNDIPQMVFPTGE